VAVVGSTNFAFGSIGVTNEILERGLSYFCGYRW